MKYTEFAYEVRDVEHDWVETLRYTSINHEVVPKERTLDCLECHREGGRMDWEALGYGEDPMMKKIRQPGFRLLWNTKPRLP